MGGNERQRDRGREGEDKNQGVEAGESHMGEEKEYKKWEEK